MDGEMEKARGRGCWVERGSFALLHAKKKGRLSRKFPLHAFALRRVAEKKKFPVTVLLTVFSVSTKSTAIIWST
jgi:hypothetical protein